MEPREDRTTVTRTTGRAGAVHHEAAAEHLRRSLSQEAEAAAAGETMASVQDHLRVLQAAGILVVAKDRMTYGTRETPGQATYRQASGPRAIYLQAPGGLIPMITGILEIQVRLDRIDRQPQLQRTGRRSLKEVRMIGGTLVQVLLMSPGRLLHPTIGRQETGVGELIIGWEA
jgi:hypothetical protein